MGLRLYERGNLYKSVIWRRFQQLEMRLSVASTGCERATAATAVGQSSYLPVGASSGAGLVNGARFKVVLL